MLPAYGYVSVVIIVFLSLWTFFNSRTFILSFFIILQTDLHEIIFKNVNEAIINYWEAVVLSETITFYIL